MRWKITYFNTNVYKTLLKWPDKLLAKYLRIMELMEKNGADLGMPFTKALGNGLFEIRASAQEGIGRVFFCTLIDKDIIVLHSFIKKTQQTPEKELSIARKRLMEVKK